MIIYSVSTGTPIQFNVLDASKITATGDGLGLVSCHKMAVINITAPGGRATELDVKVTGRSYQNIKNSMKFLLFGGFYHISPLFSPVHFLYYVKCVLF